MKVIIDFKQVEMEPYEYEYYKKLINEFTSGNLSAKDQFHDLFEVDSDGIIYEIHPNIKVPVAWVILFFVQNLMINQRIRRLEKWVKEKING